MPDRRTFTTILNLRFVGGWQSKQILSILDRKFDDKEFTSIERVRVHTHFEALRAAGHGRKNVVRVHGAHDEVRSIPFLAAESVERWRRKEVLRIRLGQVQKV